MNKVILKNRATTGELLEATFLPDAGMNMISYKLGDIEVIDQSTKQIFEERFAGLGALIGPHFHRRRKERLPIIKDELLFPHIARVKAKGVDDPFSHGIGRYAPWKTEATDTKVKAVLSGKDTWNGVPLSELEGQNFKMEYQAELLPEGLFITMSVVSDTDSLVGIHYYIHLPKGTGTVKSTVQNYYIENNERKTIPDSWNYDGNHLLTMPLDSSIDATFYPYPNPLEATITTDASDFQLVTKYSSISQENCWQLYHPQGASFVCVEPISAQDPRHPNLTTSSLKIQLQILSKSSFSGGDNAKS